MANLRTILLVIVVVESKSCFAALFSCSGRAAGYYADVASDCQQYHVCTGGRAQYTYSCPNTTRFQQRMMICDHDYLVDCARSESDFSANLLLGQRGVPFVSPDEFHPKHTSGVTYLNLSQRSSTSATSNTPRPPTYPTTTPHSKTNPPFAPFKFTKNPARQQQQSTPYFQQKPTYVKPSTLAWVSPAKTSPTPFSFRPTVAPFVAPAAVYTRAPAAPVGRFQFSTQTSSAPLKVFSNTPSTVSLTPKPPVPAFQNKPFYPQDNTPRGFSTPRWENQPFSTPQTTRIETFVATVSPLQDFSDPNLNWLRSLKQVDQRATFDDDNSLRRSGASGGVVRLEWTLPDVRAMLFIPDDPAEAVEPNIKRYSVTIPQPKMVFKSNERAVPEGPCPEHCDARFMEPGTCHPCIMLK